MNEKIIIGIMIHFVCDWFLQNHWMAINKTNLWHPAGYVHGTIHAFGMLLIMPMPFAFLVGVSHWFIDLRFVLKWWGALIRQTSDGVFALTVTVWRDQVAHLSIITLVSILID